MQYIKSIANTAVSTTAVNIVGESDSKLHVVRMSSVGGWSFDVGTVHMYVVPTAVHVYRRSFAAAAAPGQFI